MTPALTDAEAELRRLLHSIKFENPAAVTLTMKKRASSRAADAIIASENFRHFRNRLDQAILSSRAKRHGAQLLMVAVLEMTLITDCITSALSIDRTTARSRSSR
jgi:hypothetical protein